VFVVSVLERDPPAALALAAGEDAQRLTSVELRRAADG
jgi:hypothetical protein